MEKFQAGGLSCTLVLPQDYEESSRRYPVLYINGGGQTEEVAAEVVKAGLRMDFLMLGIEPASWNDDFTPWSAAPFRSGETAPAGRADDYLNRLAGQIKPDIDARYRTMPEPRNTALFGYSLGGLAALYAAYRTDLFGVVGSLSGSLWYDGFCDYMRQHTPRNPDLRIYLSLGKKEERSKNPRMAAVGECTRLAQEILRGQLEEGGAPTEAEEGAASAQAGAGGAFAAGRPPRVFLEWNEGGHFHEIPQRFVKAIAWWRGQN